MVDERTNLTQQVIAEVRTHFKDKVFETQVPRSVRLAEAPELRSAGHPLRHPLQGGGGLPAAGARAHVAGPDGAVRPVSARRSERRSAGGSRPSSPSPRPRPRRPRPAPPRSRSAPRAEPVPAALGHRPRAPGRARRLDPRERDRAADPGAARGASATRSSPASGAGGRRRRPGSRRVPVTVREVPDDQLLELALVENIQREELNAARGGAGLPAAAERVRASPRRRSRAGWGATARRSPTPCGCCACPASCASSWPRGRSTPGTRGRSSPSTAPRTRWRSGARRRARGSPCARSSAAWR